MALIQKTTTETLVHRTPEQIPEDSAWYAVQTMPRHERKVVAELQRKDLRTFLPVFPETRRWSDRRRVIEMPLFPGYVFVQLNPTPDMRISVLRTSGVTSFVGVRGIGIPIPDSQIATIQKVVEQRLQCKPYPFLSLGQRVRIRGGSLDGIEGILVQVKSDQSLVISVELIQRSLAIRVAGYRIESI
jgi:transcription termination/antitermination protein NusG